MNRRVQGLHAVGTALGVGGNGMGARFDGFLKPEDELASPRILLELARRSPAGSLQ